MLRATIGRATLVEADPMREATFGAMRREEAIVIDVGRMDTRIVDGIEVVEVGGRMDVRERIEGRG